MEYSKGDLKQFPVANIVDQHSPYIYLCIGHMLLVSGTSGRLSGMTKRMENIILRYRIFKTGSQTVP